MCSRTELICLAELISGMVSVPQQEDTRLPEMVGETMSCTHVNVSEDAADTRKTIHYDNNNCYAPISKKLENLIIITVTEARL